MTGDADVNDLLETELSEILKQRLVGRHAVKVDFQISDAKLYSNRIYHQQLARRISF